MPGSPTGRLPAAAVVGSLLWHAIVLLFLGSLYRPTARQHLAPPDVTPREISYVVLPRLGRTSFIMSPEEEAPSAEASEPATSPRAPSPDSAAGLTRESRSPAAVAGSPAAASAAPLFRSGFTDPRLYIDAGALRRVAPRGLQERFDASFHAALGAAEDSLAEERRRERASNQVRVFGRRATIFGDSSNAYWRGFIAGNRRMTMPVDGREWEDLQMKKQRDDFVRDSILRARTAVTRARVDAERMKNQR